MDPARLPDNVPEEVLVELFVRSARQTLDRLREAMLRLADHPGEPAVREVVRLCHNLKGSSRQMGFDDLGQMAEEMETLAHPIDSLPIVASPAVRDAMEAAAGEFRRFLDALEAGKSTPDLTAMTARLHEAQP